jgi:four helix bundle suffix protein
MRPDTKEVGGEFKGQSGAGEKALSWTAPCVTLPFTVKPRKPASDVRDKSDAKNPPRAILRPLSPSNKKNLAPDRFILPHGGYEKLLSFQKARIVYDGTVRFCARFLKKSDRTCDQMIQAARSGKQNILEGSEASGISKETEIKLTGVARASLGELLEDYRDFLRVRSLEEWSKEHRYTRRLRELNRQPNANYDTFKKGIEHPDPAVAANVMIGLIKLTNYLLDQQIRQLEKAFVNEGGLRERMTRARLAQRARQSFP